GVAEHRRAIAREPARSELADLFPVHAHDAGGRPLEPGEEAKQRRLARAARPEDGEHLAVRHAQRQALQGGGVSLRRRMHAEHVAELDRGLHAATSAARDGARPRSIVAAPTSTTAATTYASAASASSGRSRDSQSGGSGSADAAVTETSAITSAERIAPSARPPRTPKPATRAARRRRCVRIVAGDAPCASRSKSSPRSSRTSPTTDSTSPSSASRSATTAV